ncbi:MOSC domain-containing protein [Gluconobacter morbifer]|uniref:MOSC domain-containing protein n=1 Tax=Gluconobacter morbifer G707 TaxID=1088869 RepID=G6XMK0_9PROT|nr:MOSC N-terminal beta barrel domain-containing protein [Gluconobacter morbifer]EHH67098.1 hypothetical protein GMO_27180 [Gluconobacter morbifer G707]
MLRIESLHKYPVKSCHRISPDHLSFEPWGAAGDRQWGVFDPDGVFLTQRAHPVMARIGVQVDGAGLVLQCAGQSDLAVAVPAGAERSVRVWGDDMPAVDAGEGAAHWLSQVIGHPCRLAYMASPATARPRLYDGNGFHVSFADEFPVLVCTTASLADLNTHLASPVPMTRFRPNVVIAGAEPWEEDSWTRLRIGTVELRLVKPCPRCGVTTVDQESGALPDRREPLRALAEFRKQPGGVMFGQNAVVDVPGMMRVGDEVTVLERRAVS